MEWGALRMRTLRGAAIVVIFWAVAATGAPADRPQPSDSAVAASVQEVPQRSMTVKSAPGPYPFNGREPFVVDSTENVEQHLHSAIGAFNTRQPASRSDDYVSYDYDSSKLEEVPYDYRGDPIDRKDVHAEPGAVRPNDISRPSDKSKPLMPTDIYQYLNLPKQYSSSDFKYPLVSSSYANTKVQGSGSPSSPLSNHKMPADTVSASPTTTTAVPWYNAVKTTVKPTVAATTTTVAATTARTTTTTTTTPPPSQEYEEYDYGDYNYHPSQEPALSPSTSTTTTTTTTRATTITTAGTTTTTAAATTTVANVPPQLTVHRNSPPSYVLPESTSATTTQAVTEVTKPSTTTERRVTVGNAMANKTTTTVRPEIDLKLDGTSFADYDTVDKPAAAVNDKARPQDFGQNSFKPLPGNYQFDDKTYPLMTGGKTPMTFTAHVSSGISLNQKENRPPAAVSEPVVYSSRPPQPEIQDQDDHRDVVRDRDSPKPTSGGRPATDASANPSEFSKSKPSARPSASTADQTVNNYYQVRPDQYSPQFPVQNRPTNLPPVQSRPYQPEPVQSRPYQPEPVQSRPYQPEPVQSRPYQPEPIQNRPYQPEPIQSKPYQPEPVQSRPYQPEPLVVKTSQADIARKPANADQLYTPPQGRPQPYPGQSDVYVKNKPQYVPPPTQSQPDTSKFKPPKHVINHFIKTLPDEDNKSYALQTSFSIGMDGERTEGRPGQGVGQVLMVKDGSAEDAADDRQPSPTVKQPKPTTSVPLIHHQQRPAAVQKPQPLYPRPVWETAAKPVWETAPKPAAYYPPPPPPPPQSPKRDGGSPPVPRPGLPNILPQFRPNAKMDTVPVAPQSHSATIERVQIPMDHLRPPPLPKPQFLKVDRNDDEDADEEVLDIPEKETRILQRTGPQPAKVTTLQMIQHGAPTKVREDNVDDSPAVHVVYAANPPPRPATEKPTDDPAALMLQDAHDRSDVPVLKTKTTAVAANRQPAAVKTDFPYQIVRPDDTQNGSSLEYQAFSPTRSDAVRPINNDQELVPNLQDYVPVATRDSAATVLHHQKPITATLKTATAADNHKSPADESGNVHHGPTLQNFQIPFQPSVKMPENGGSNGWSVVRKPAAADNAADRVDEAAGGDAAAASTEKFDPDNFKPQLVGGFMPISAPLDEDAAAEKKPVEHSERA